MYNITNPGDLLGAVRNGPQKLDSALSVNTPPVYAAIGMVEQLKYTVSGVFLPSAVCRRRVL
jgi:hypothetical protein